MTFLEKLENASPQEQVTLLNERFNKNYKYFKESHPNLIKYLDQKLTRYSLHISHSGINIKDNSDNSFVYPVEDEKSLLFDISKTIANTPTRNPLWKISTNSNVLYENIQEENLPFTTKLITTIVDTIKSDKNFDRNIVHFDNSKNMPTTIFLGIGAAIHIDYLINQFDYFHGIFLYEPNWEMFVISSYFLDYENLHTKTTPHSCYIVVNGFLPPDIVKNFFSTKLITNSYVRVVHQGYKDQYTDDAVNIINQIARETTRGWGTYDDEMIGFKNKLKNIDIKDLKYKILNQKKIQDIPICIIGNGPSLNNLLPFIKQNMNNMIIISAGTALAPLLNAGIQVDFQVEIERMGHVKKWLENANMPKDLIMLAADVIDPSTLSVGENNLLFIRSSSSCERVYDPKHVLPFSNPLVGNAALAIALNYSSKIIMCGIDVGFKQTGKQHATGSLYDQMSDKSEEMYPTRGNFSTDIFTNSLFSLSRDAMEKAIQLAGDVEVYNLSDGAFIAGAKPIRSKDLILDLKDKKSSIKEILKTFSKEPTEIFNNSEIDYKDELDSYINDIIKIANVTKPINKRALFYIIDLLFTATTIQRREKPVTGTLLCGTIWHLINTIFIGLLHIDRRDTTDIYEKIIKEVEEIFKEITI